MNLPSQFSVAHICTFTADHLGLDNISGLTPGEIDFLS